MLGCVAQELYGNTKIIKWGTRQKLGTEIAEAERSAKCVLLNITLPAERELDIKCEKALSNYLFLFIK